MKKPWEFNQDLTQERIVELANFIVSVRGEVIDMHNEELGDTPLSLGMRAYECCRSRLIKLSDSGRFPWLSILTPEKRFTFCIGKTPVRFMRSETKEISNAKLILSEEAGKKINQLPLFPDFRCENFSIRWFFIIDTYYKQPADNVYFVGYDKGGDIHSEWNIPIGDKVSLLSTANDHKPEAVELPAPQPRWKKKTIIKTEISDEKK